MNQLQVKNAEFLTNILQEANFLNDEVFDFFMDGEGEVKGIKFFIYRIVGESDVKYTLRNIDMWLPKIIMSMNNFIDNFPSTPSYRQTVYECFYEWCKKIADLSYGCDAMLETICGLEPPTYDPAIYLIKKMHGNGVSKKEVSDQFQIEPRTVWNNIQRLDVKNKGKLPPLRIGGQPVYVDIEAKEKGSAHRSFYRTKNTMHPLVMQYNVTQVMMLFKSFQLYFKQTESQICYKMALDAWCQLSDYGKKKLIEKYAKRDKELGNFLNELKDWECDNKVLIFEPEEDFLKEGSGYTVKDKVDTAVKTGAVCDVLFKDATIEILHDQRILHDDNGLFAVPYKEVDGYKHIGYSKKHYFDYSDIDDLVK